MRLRLAVLALLFVAGCRGSEVSWVAVAPAGDRPTAIDRNGETVLPNGRLLTPEGRSIQVAPHPYGLALSRDGRRLVTANSGIRPFSVTIIDRFTGDDPDVRQIPPGALGDEGILEAVFMGLAFSPGGDTLYAGGGIEGGVLIFDVDSGDRIGMIDVNGVHSGRHWEDSYIGDLVLSPDGRSIYAVDQTNFRVVVLDTPTGQLVASVPVGRYPFGITLSPDGRSLHVANVGMFEYSLVTGLDPEADPPRFGPSFPVTAFGTQDMRTGTEEEGYGIPGLGDPNADESFSVWEIDVSDRDSPVVTARVKTGYLVGERVADFPTVGGSSPNSLVTDGDHVFVSNGHNDSVSIIDTKADSVVVEIPLRLDSRLGELRGHIPFGLALSPDRSRLYVAEAGINAVAVIDVGTSTVLGHIPVGWFPSKLAVTSDGRHLVVANAKGWGSGPNGGPSFDMDERGAYIGSLMHGFVSVIAVPDDSTLEDLTQRVVDNNVRFIPASRAGLRNNPVPAYPGASETPIRHIVFVTKENRTYDEVFGEIEGATGEASLARFGHDVNLVSSDGLRTVDNVSVMPNHQALARRFAVADNFYCDSDVSADGHRWLVGVYPNEWVETGVAASYGGKRRMRRGSTAPGMLAFVGSSGAIYPEDYPEAGSVWDHFERNGIDFFNFGLGFEFAPGFETEEFRYTGIRLPINYPMPGPLRDRTSRRYATYNMAIPDQFRMDMFIEEFESRWSEEGQPMPQVLTVLLPNDHGAGERPDAGYPFFESYMADNDLALGRLVQFLSGTPYWKDMAIVVTEDDPQGGVDHVDAHRSVLMVISPWVKPGYVSSVHYSFGSIWKTVWHLLGLPYLNQYDATATDMADFFASEPDTTTYHAILPDPGLFDPQQALDPFDADFDWSALGESPGMDDVETMKAWADTMRTGADGPRPTGR